MDLLFDLKGVEKGFSVNASKKYPSRFMCAIHACSTVGYPAHHEVAPTTIQIYPGADG